MPSASRSRTVQRFRHLIRMATGSYILALLALVGLVYGPGEDLWPVTLFLFGPRWVLAVPLLLLGVLCFFADRRLLFLVVAAAIGLARPLGGFNVPWGSLGWSVDRAPGQRFRLVSWNVGELRSEDDLWHLLENEAPDVVLLEECEADDLQPPVGWHSHTQWDMCLLSRFPILDVAPRDRREMWRGKGSGRIVRYALDTSLGRLDLTHVHLETPREGLEAILRSGPGGIERLEARNEQREYEAHVARAWVDEGTAPLALVVGDFNTPVESNIFREHWGGFQDCHSVAGWGFGFTKRTRRIGVRIDHVLAGPGLQCLEARAVSGLDGDHSPVVVLVGARLVPSDD